VVVFQPHTFTRTRSFLGEFAESLQAADVAIICEIYAARERDTLGMSGRLLAERIEALAPGKAHFASDLAAAADLAAVLLRPGDVLITFGAGDVWKVGEMLLSGNAATRVES
jgi:UDP-N-acetylmuramate--alanine ligase